MLDLDTLQVKYSFPEDLGKPIMQICEARKAKSFHKTSPEMAHNSSLKEGETMEGALKECQHQVRGAKWNIPSQLHFYMEPQTALAQGDGEGGMEVPQQTSWLAGWLAGCVCVCMWLRMSVQSAAFRC